jgi:predicted DsbA family dithiol-disulfide isomerase
MSRNFRDGVISPLPGSRARVSHISKTEIVMAQSAPPVRVDIVSDVVCPWCIIGYRQLLQAQELSGIEAEIRWHPFELNPDMPDEGQDMREHIAQKYGSTPEQSQSSRDRITALGADLGFDFRFTPEMRMWNTFRAHQLLDWAEEDGHQTALKEALFAAHFTEGRDVSDPGVLVEVAAEAGLDPARARDAAATPAAPARNSASGSRGASPECPRWSLPGATS